MVATGTAEAYGMDDLIGWIASGCCANIVMLDLASIGIILFHDSINQIVHAEY